MTAAPHFATLVHGEMANLASYGVSLDEAIESLYTGPGGTPEPRLVARLSLAALLLGAHAGDRLDEALVPVEPAAAPPAEAEHGPAPRRPVLTLLRGSAC